MNTSSFHDSYRCYILIPLRDASLQLTCFLLYKNSTIQIVEIIVPAKLLFFGLKLYLIPDRDSNVITRTGTYHQRTKTVFLHIHNQHHNHFY